MFKDVNEVQKEINMLEAAPMVGMWAHYVEYLWNKYINAIHNHVVRKTFVVGGNIFFFFGITFKN
jgi:hypothetical protein